MFYTINASVEPLKVASSLDFLAQCQTRLSSFAADRHDALFVVGSLDETLELRGLRYHPIDIETSVSRAHRSIAER